jgi:hypothetical protein
MLLRRTLPVVVAAVALAGCPSVDTDGTSRIAVATFDVETGTIPVPNDLLLQAAPALGESPTRSALLSSIAAGGFSAMNFPTPGQPTVVAIPVTVRERQGDDSYASAAPEGIDRATVNDTTVALVRIDVSPPQRVTQCASPTSPTPPCFIADFLPDPTAAVGRLVLVPIMGPTPGFAPGRYVAALREGIRTAEGLDVLPDASVFLLRQAPPANAEELPPIAAEDLASLNQLRGIYAGQSAWTGQACALASLAAPCWIPVPSELPSAFLAVSTVFPVAEIVSIQTFTIAGPPTP